MCPFYKPCLIIQSDLLKRACLGFITHNHRKFAQFRVLLMGYQDTNFKHFSFGKRIN